MKIGDKQNFQNKKVNTENMVEICILSLGIKKLLKINFITKTTFFFK